MKPTITHVSGIETAAVENQSADTAVIFLHGYGASMNDLLPLWELWHRPNFSWFFPNGVLSLPMGFYEGRAWFPIDMEKLQDAIQRGAHREMADSIPENFDETLKQLESYIGELKTRYKKIILGGFSQGAMCSSHLAIRSGIALDGLVLLSGNLVAQSHFPPHARSIPFYQSHGQQDPVLSVQGAKALEAKLHALGFQGKLHTFQGGHEIPMSVINEVKNYLEQFA